MTNITYLPSYKEWGRRKFEIAERNRDNFNRWRIRWLEYWAMVEYEGENYSPYNLMTGRSR